MSQAGVRQLLYISNDDQISGCGCVEITDADRDRGFGRLTSGLTDPVGVAVDSALNVYVGDTFGSNGGNILVYKRGAKTAFRTISQLGGTSNTLGAVAVGPDGPVYAVISNLIDEIAPGASSPAYVLKDPTITNPSDVAVSASNLVYVAFNGNVKRFKPGSSKGKLLPFQAGLIDGIAFDSSGDVVVSDRQNTDIEVFTQNSKMPIRTFGSGLGIPLFIAFDASQKHLYVIELQATSGDVNIDIFDYSSGTMTSSTLASVASFGIALSPPPPG